MLRFGLNTPRTPTKNCDDGGEGSEQEDNSGL
jgi:hypothetical protein